MSSVGLRESTAASRGARAPARKSRGSGGAAAPPSSTGGGRRGGRASAGENVPPAGVAAPRGASRSRSAAGGSRAALAPLDVNGPMSSLPPRRSVRGRRPAVVNHDQGASSEEDDLSDGVAALGDDGESDHELGSDDEEDDGGASGGGLRDGGVLDGDDGSSDEHARDDDDEETVDGEVRMCTRTHAHAITKGSISRWDVSRFWRDLARCVRARGAQAIVDEARARARGRAARARRRRENIPFSRCFVARRGRRKKKSDSAARARAHARAHGFRIIV